MKKDETDVSDTPQPKPAAKPKATPAAEADAAVVQPATKTHLGRKAETHPNRAYSLLSGPDSPGPADFPGRVNIDDLKEN